MTTRLPRRCGPPPSPRPRPAGPDRRGAATVGRRSWPSVIRGLQWTHVEVRRHGAFAAWFTALRDFGAQARIRTRIKRLEGGNFGDAKSVGEGVSELRIDHGPGYRIYFINAGQRVVLLLAGGDRKTKAKDIRRAIALANEFRKE